MAKPCIMCGTTDYSITNPHVVKHGGIRGGKEFDVCMNCNVKVNYTPMRPPDTVRSSTGEAYYGFDRESVYDNVMFKNRRDQNHRLWDELR